MALYLIMSTEFENIKESPVERPSDDEAVDQLQPATIDSEEITRTGELHLNKMFCNLHMRKKI